MRQICFCLDNFRVHTRTLHRGWISVARKLCSGARSGRISRQSVSFGAPPLASYLSSSTQFSNSLITLASPA